MVLFKSKTLNKFSNIFLLERPRCIWIREHQWFSLSEAQNCFPASSLVHPTRRRSVPPSQLIPHDQEKSEAAGLGSFMESEHHRRPSYVWQWNAFDGTKVEQTDPQPLSSSSEPEPEPSAHGAAVWEAGPASRFCFYTSSWTETVRWFWAETSSTAEKTQENKKTQMLRCLN